MNKVYCFGDSWAAGAELDKTSEYPFVHWFSQSTNSEYINYGAEGASLGIILYTLVLNINKLTKEDVVLIIIPPDVRWYDENLEQGFFSLMQWMTEDYMKSLNNKTVEWFKYHHLLFIYTMQQMLNEIGCKYVMAHNYGQLPTNNVYKFPIDYSKFLNKTDLTNLLSEKHDPWQSYQLKIDGPMHEHSWHGKYFEGNVDHPNELGHKKIAELFLEYFNE
jgi:hypothetical protein